MSGLFFGITGSFHRLFGAHEKLVSDGLPDTPRFLGDPMRLQHADRYRLRLREDLIARSLGLDENTQDTLEKLGFVNVSRFTSSRDLPAGWALATVMTYDPLTIWAEANWNGPSSHVPRPTGLWQIWPAPRPSN